MERELKTVDFKFLIAMSLFFSFFWIFKYRDEIRLGGYYYIGVFWAPVFCIITFVSFGVDYLYVLFNGFSVWTAFLMVYFLLYRSKKLSVNVFLSSFFIWLIFLYLIIKK